MSLARSNSTFFEDITQHDKICLVNGYTREESKEKIPPEIARIFYDYYEHASCWTINKEMLAKISSQDCIDKEFTSSSFAYNDHNPDLQWVLKCKGYKAHDTGDHCFQFWLDLNPWPSRSVSCITAACTLTLFAKHKMIRKFKKTKQFQYYYTTALTNELNRLPVTELTDYESITIGVYIDFLGVEFEDADDEELGTEYQKPYDLILQRPAIKIDEEIEFEWKINDELLGELKNAKVGNIFYSKTFGIGGNWCLSIAPNGDRYERRDNVILSVHLLRVKAMELDVQPVKGDYELKLIADGAETTFTEPASFRYYSWWYWPELTFSNEKFQSISTVTIKAKIWNISVD